MGVQLNETLPKSCLILLPLEALQPLQDGFDFAGAKLRNFASTMAIEDAEEGRIAALTNLQVDDQGVLHRPPPTLHTTRAVSQVKAGICLATL